MTWTDLPGAVRTLSRRMEGRRAERWARKAYSDLDQAFLHLLMGRGPTPTSGWWEIGIEVVPHPALTGLIGWRLVVERKRMRTLHAQLETTDRTQGWAQIESNEFPDDTPSSSIAAWAGQSIRTRFEDYLASLRKAIEVAFQRNGDDVAVRDAGLDVVEKRNGADGVIGWTLVVDIRDIADRTFTIVITQHEVLLKAIAYQGEGIIGRKQIVAGTTATHIVTWACNQIHSQSRK